MDIDVKFYLNFMNAEVLKALPGEPGRGDFS